MSRNRLALLVLPVCFVVAAAACTDTDEGAPAASGSSPRPTDAATEASRVVLEDDWGCQTDPARLFDAALNDDRARAAELMSRCIEDPATTRQDDVALHRAAQSGSLSVARLLISSGADVEYEDAGGDNALTWAATPAAYMTARHDRRKADITRALIDAGADPNAPGRGGVAAIHQAASGDFLLTLAVLVDAGADVDARTSKGITPLMVAASQGHTRTARRLLELGASIKTRDKSGQNAVDKAQAGGHEALAAVLREG